MNFKTQALPAALHTIKTDCLLLPQFDEKSLDEFSAAVDESLNGALSTLKKQGDLPTAAGKCSTLPVTANSGIKRVIVFGLGKRKQLTAQVLRKALKALYGQVSATSTKNAHLAIDSICNETMDSASVAAEAVIAFETGAYQYKETLGKKPVAPKLATLTLLSKDNRKLKNALNEATGTANGVNTARELGNLPGNFCTPLTLADKAKAMAKSCAAMKTSILDEKKMAQLGMGSLLSVAAGSKLPARMIVMDYQGGGKQKPTVLVGKGITFDSGGISLKPGAGMDEMKFDMCGAAAVFGVMQALVDMQAKVNVVGVVAAAENMPGSQATKPGDIVTSMSGKTIEILNTDAEGRLVLCDTLTYVERYKPKAVIDVATLTGACIISLGHHATGLFANDDKLAEALTSSGEATGDRAWRLPIWDEYQEQLKSNFADLANIGGRAAGSITAARFLSNFTENYPWAHLDIAGTAWDSGARKGATGKPVRLLLNYLLG
jgi:leucyl aminopeptidase